ncbi:HNH endonuclease [Armatimonas sp.]|uniref:HNH endonuclease n=1 Tax=Armatimonas sp. TaxID=1872638 RepID=UPI0037528221
MIRARLFKGLTTGKMEMRTLYDDEKVKLIYSQACCYCGTTEALSIDHLIPQIKGGADYSDNLVWACRSCNSSKRDRDLLDWCQTKNTFPSILLLRRYMKLVARYCEEHELLDTLLADALKQNLPFKLQLLPYSFPALSTLVLWVPNKQQESDASTGVK